MKPTFHRTKPSYSSNLNQVDSTTFCRSFERCLLHSINLNRLPFRILQIGCGAVNQRPALCDFKFANCLLACRFQLHASLLKSNYWATHNLDRMPAIMAAFRLALKGWKKSSSWNFERDWSIVVVCQYDVSNIICGRSLNPDCEFPIQSEGFEGAHPFERKSL